MKEAAPISPKTTPLPHRQSPEKTIATQIIACVATSFKACRMDRGHGGQDELIAGSGLLNAFLEILLYQSIH